jgi:hypothetical protein
MDLIQSVYTWLQVSYGARLNASGPCWVSWHTRYIYSPWIILYSLRALLAGRDFSAWK